ncbi:hypothetical protein TrST_g13041 [Triparma strigata]|uniref:alpha,alpha-trehalase n=1 Tax=Triparma strigata TaxID=1606541 RepID=A0A9W6ZR39_9STRA|nr:hypothetical protein TrST_g13041 [Triparma strigata]
MPLMHLHVISCLLLTQNVASLDQFEDDAALVKDYVLNHYKDTFREPNGTLAHPYLVPGGPYSQSWDWDSVFTGLALLDLGSAPYLAGSMKNFFDQTNLTTGEVTICVDPTTTSPSCSSDPADNQASGSHAKPLLIQGALVSADFTGDYMQFHAYKDKMASLLKYWEDVRLDTTTSLYTWHDQMENGADNLVLSPCPSPRSECWNDDGCANSLSAPDLMTFLIREHLAYAKFLDQWGEDGGDEERSKAAEVAKAMNDELWSEKDGFHHARNVTSGSDIDFATYVLGFPLWAGEGAISKEQASVIVDRLMQPDMLGNWGVRSTSSENEFYNNDDIITPYSNWQGPIWVNSNVITAYGMLDHGFDEEALVLVQRVMAALAADLRDTGEWHEDYNAEDGTGISADGFLSWNTLGYRMANDIAKQVNPMKL